MGTTDRFGCIVMCAIFGSEDLRVFIELAEINKHRGGFSYSIMAFDKDLNILNIAKSKDSFPTHIKDIQIQDAKYYLGHVQAPTDGIGSLTKIHPAHIKANYLYHNGQIKPRSIECGKWDTEWILEQLLQHDPIDYRSSLNNIDGSFACVFIKSNPNKITLFTNQTCAIFKSGTDISSTRINRGWNRLIPCIVYEFHLSGINECQSFDNIDRTYYIP